MSIRAIAQEVYKCQSKVHKLEDQLVIADPQEKDKIKDDLRRARAELKILKNMLEGRKEHNGGGKKKYPFKY